MAESKMNLKPAEETKPVKAVEEKVEEKVNVPKEYTSAGDAMRVVIDGETIQVYFSAELAEVIGSYRRIKGVMVEYKEGGQAQPSFDF